VVELLDRPDQPEDALLDQVEERQPEPAVALGVGHDEAQVRLDHAVLGGLVAALDALGELDLLLGREQRPLRDVAQEDLERVAGGLGHGLVRVARGRLLALAGVGQLDAAALGLAVERLEPIPLDLEPLHGRRHLGELERPALLRPPQEVFYAALEGLLAHVIQHTPGQAFSKSAPE
jgi:hypothetical protein